MIVTAWLSKGFRKDFKTVEYIIFKEVYFKDWTQWYTSQGNNYFIVYTGDAPTHRAQGFL